MKGKKDKLPKNSKKQNLNYQKNKLIKLLIKIYF